MKKQSDYSEKSCGCMEKSYNYMDQNECKYSYIDPIFDMTPMQYMGNMPSKYMTMDTPYIMTYEDVDNINDMWNNYYMYIQKMIKSMS